jgi:hypothetical protein
MEVSQCLRLFGFSPIMFDVVHLPYPNIVANLSRRKRGILGYFNLVRDLLTVRSKTGDIGWEGQGECIFIWGIDLVSCRGAKVTGKSRFFSTISKQLGPVPI